MSRQAGLGGSLPSQPSQPARFGFCERPCSQNWWKTTEKGAQYRLLAFISMHTHLHIKYTRESEKSSTHTSYKKIYIKTVKNVLSWNYRIYTLNLYRIYTKHCQEKSSELWVKLGVVGLPLFSTLGQKQNSLFEESLSHTMSSRQAGLTYIVSPCLKSKTKQNKKTSKRMERHSVR